MPKKKKARCCFGHECEQNPKEGADRPTSPDPYTPRYPIGKEILYYFEIITAMTNLCHRPKLLTHVINGCVVFIEKVTSPIQAA